MSSHQDLDPTDSPYSRKSSRRHIEAGEGRIFFSDELAGTGCLDNDLHLLTLGQGHDTGGGCLLDVQEGGVCKHRGSGLSRGTGRGEGERG
ncbi:hypothetical protein ElyMa_005671400 [Elysia marginata]|uniref:Uncharacterized protein n=1 Tax=Elysia marginata TaxID=1093978 RepID=A0AAV4FE17_9GAST|nr:hypothetical protein ElyMa_005671400 [Elysia marginata]